MAEENPDPETEAGKGGKKKLILIMIVAVVLLLGGGAAAFFLMGDDEQEVAAEGEAEEEEDEAFEGEPTYHEMKPEFVVNLLPGGHAKMLQVGVQVYTRDPAVVDVLSKHDPMLRHHLFNVLSGQAADTLTSREGREQLQSQLKDELVSKLKSVGENKAHIESVYFTQFVLQ